MARKRQKQSRTTEPISRTERKLLAAYRSMTMAATHLDNCNRSFKDALNSDNFTILADRYRSLFGVRVSLSCSLLMAVLNSLTLSLPVTIAISRKELTIILNDLESSMARLVATISTTTIPASAQAANGGKGSKILQCWDMCGNPILPPSLSPKKHFRNHRNISPTKAATAR